MPVLLKRWKAIIDKLLPGVASANAKMSNCQLTSASCMHSVPTIRGSVLGILCAIDPVECTAPNLGKCPAQRIACKQLFAGVHELSDSTV